MSKKLVAYFSASGIGKRELNSHCMSRPTTQKRRILQVFEPVLISKRVVNPKEGFCRSKNLLLLSANSPFRP